jgi:two-component system, OmpR family, sensor histidine kinase MtrB
VQTERSELRPPALFKLGAKPPRAEGPPGFRLPVGVQLIASVAVVAIVMTGIGIGLAVSDPHAGWKQALVMGGAALALFLLLGVAVHKRILEPLRRLTAAIEVAGQDGGLGEVHVDGPAEIEQLADEFNLVTARHRVEGIQNTHLAAASHELRGPLNAVVGLAETMIHHEARLDPQLRGDMLRRISSSGMKMDRILSDLFDVLRAEDDERPARQSIDLGVLARRTLARADGLRGRVVDIDAQGVVREVDGRMVQRILENLLSNAGKHAGPAAHIWIRLNDGAEGVTIAVDDDGPGVPTPERERIFDRFERGNGTNASGLGLGLSVVSRFAKLHGGRAWVEDRDGGGASFRVLLPSPDPSPA